MAENNRTVTVTIESPGLDDTLAKLERVKALADEIRAMGFGPTAVSMPAEGVTGVILDDITSSITEPSSTDKDPASP